MVRVRPTEGTPNLPGVRLLFVAGLGGMRNRREIRVRVCELVIMFVCVSKEWGVCTRVYKLVDIFCI